MPKNTKFTVLAKPFYVGKAKQVYTIGDAKESGLIFNAIAGGARIAREI